ncbi:cell division ATP-binding protein FtsE [Sulfurospirillum sp. 1612]|uniref:cell division ATP-binding protein FtsE n=1 Tax=Sulfurospirillum sp. 1612 TaxID=3094835 RepID=UPI002F942AD9
MEYVIHAQDLSINYDREEPVITEASLGVHSHDFVFITGKSGSGKSTLLKSFYGELAAQKGILEICGINMQKIGNNKLNLLRRYLGIIFQDYKLIPSWTIEKNIMLPLMIGGFSKSVCEAQAVKLLRHVKLTHKIGKYPLELSGGEQQRVAIARALAHNPILILADEPTGNLDDYSSEVIWGLLKNAREHLGTTVVVVTHHIPSTIGIDYKHLFLDKGILHEVP